MAQVVTLLATKGGVGKTTLAAHLAVALRASLVDLDPQGSLRSWREARDAEAPRLLSMRPRDFGTAKGVVIVDTPPQRSKIHDEAVAISDLILIPTRPSALDLVAIRSALDLVAAHKKPFGFVLSQAVSRSRLSEEALVALSSEGAVAAVVALRQAFPSSMVDGRTVLETEPRGKAAEEIGKLAAWVRKSLNKIRPLND